MVRDLRVDANDRARHHRARQQLALGLVGPNVLLDCVVREQLDGLGAVADDEAIVRYHGRERRFGGLLAASSP